MKYNENESEKWVVRERESEIAEVRNKVREREMGDEAKSVKE